MYASFVGFEKIRKEVYEFTLEEGGKFLEKEEKSTTKIQLFYEFYKEIEILMTEGFQK